VVFFFQCQLEREVLKDWMRGLIVFHHVVYRVRLKVCQLSLPIKRVTLISDTFFPQYITFFKILDIVNLVSLILVALYCLLWVGVLYRCPKFRVRSRYVVGTAIALMLWHLPGFITLVAKPAEVLCLNEITMASNSHRLCAIQGRSHFEFFNV
jgi:hypothetical protein